MTIVSYFLSKLFAAVASDFPLNTDMPNIVTLDLKEAIENILFSGNSVVEGLRHTDDEVARRLTPREGTRVQINFSADGAACGNHGMVLSAFSVKDTVLLKQIEENKLRKRSNVRKRAETADGKPIWQSVNAIVLCGFCKGKDSDENMKRMCGSHIEYLEELANRGFLKTSENVSYPVQICISGDKKMLVQILGR